MKIRKLNAAVRALLLAGFAMAAPAAQATDAQARALLKAMSDYIGSLSSIETNVDTALDVVTPDMQKISFTSSSLLRLQRPNALRLDRNGALARTVLIFDGKMLTVRDLNANAYAQVPVTGSINELVAAVESNLGLAVPGADLLLQDSYKILVADVLEAQVIGHGVVAGQTCDHVAFRNFDTDWQLWIRQGPEKIPCKMVITSKTVGMAPQYVTHVRSWTSNPRIAPDSFAFRPASGERRVEVSSMAVEEAPPSGSTAPQ